MNKLKLIIPLILTFILSCTNKLEISQKKFGTKKKEVNKIEFLGINIWGDSSFVLFSDSQLDEKKCLFSINKKLENLFCMKSNISYSNPNIYLEKLNLPYEFELQPKNVVNFYDKIDLGSYLFIADEKPLNIEINHYNQINDSLIKLNLDVSDLSYGLSIIKLDFKDANYELYDCKYVNVNDNVTRTILVKNESQAILRMKLF